MQNLKLSSLSTWLLPFDGIGSATSAGNGEDTCVAIVESRKSHAGPSSFDNGARITNVSESATGDAANILQSTITACAWDAGRSLLLAISKEGLLHGMSYDATGDEQVS